MASVRRDVCGGGLVGGLLVGGSRGQGVVALAAALTALSLVESAYAGKNVQVDHIARGTAKFDRNGSVLTIRAADRTIINYRRFDVGSGETVRFIQPSATSRVLNRITSSTPSKIDGTVASHLPQAIKRLSSDPDGTLARAVERYQFAATAHGLAAMRALFDMLVEIYASEREVGSAALRMAIVLGGALPERRAYVDAMHEAAKVIREGTPPSPTTVHVTRQPG